MTQATEIAIIRRAREIISDPERWTQGYLARAENNLAIEPLDPRARCWCAMGALDRAAHELDMYGKESWCRALGIVYDFTPDNSIADVNDRDGHAAVLALFDRAMASEAAP